MSSTPKSSRCRSPRTATSCLLGPGSAELLDELDVDLLELLAQRKALGAAGEVVGAAGARPGGATATR